MTDPWQTLRRAGLPLGTHDRAAAPPPISDLASAVQVAIAEQPTGRARDALSAFVLAWRRHWRRSFERELGLAAPSVIAWADRAVTDTNRDLKLARIATEHLAHLL